MLKLTPCAEKRGFFFLFRICISLVPDEVGNYFRQTCAMHGNDDDFRRSAR